MTHHSPPSELDPTQVTIPAGHAWRKLPWIGLIVGLIGLGASYALALKGGHGASDGHHANVAYFSYLTAYLFWLSLSLGGLFFVLVQHATRAGWSVVVRRVAEAFMVPLWWLLPIGLVPILLGAHDLFHWTHADAVAHDELLQHKAPYLNLNFFYARAGIYVVAWLLLSWWFHRRSVAQDKSGDPRITHRMQRMSGPALIVYALTTTFAAVDWILSLDPHWFSTMYGVYFFAGSTVSVFAALSLATLALRHSKIIGQINAEHFHDLGKLLFAFTVFWTYIAFSQYMLVWYANLPEETAWYAHRMGKWQNISILLALGHFVVPFFFLMSRHVKRKPLGLTVGAVWLLVMHFVDLHWLVMPTASHGFHLTALDMTTFVGLGGLWLFVVTFSWTRHPLVPVKDPRLAESLAFENF